MGVCKHHTAEQTITGDSEAVFGFQVDHIEAAIAALDIAPAGIAVGIPAGAGKEQVRGTAVAKREPVVAPEGKDVVAARGEVTDRKGDKLPGIHNEGGPVVVAAKEGKIGVINETEVITFGGVDRVTP